MHQSSMDNYQRFGNSCRSTVHDVSCEDVDKMGSQQCGRQLITRYSLTPCMHTVPHTAHCTCVAVAQSSYSMTFKTTPVPTVLLPSLRENRWPSSRGMSLLRVRVSSVLSPGITISFPSGSWGGRRRGKTQGGERERSKVVRGRGGGVAAHTQ